MEIIVINQCKEANIEALTKYYELIADQTQRKLKLDKQYSLSVIFVTDEQIKIINRDYRQIDKPTDVISFASLDHMEPFELEAEEVELGDIFISVDAINRQAAEYGHSNLREASFLFMHGLLHLLGYDHMTSQDESVMFTLQDTILDVIIKR
ncbi:Endoribonuclease YbeY [bioreactor metagenome]|uniref:Endoribonuclease YbeY n=1 Tax=bioreactor metagenome TaxID=1076179 RepID=A0A645C5K9_9ZZZZ|nr:rRNA maturation RNase YbeY [Erysipelotrichaceae bacterium]